jgi:uncharacterized protein YndB with AHSA1/START domain
MVPERIEREIVIDAPLDVVWAVVTEPEHVAGWFSDVAEIDLRPGGEARFTWHDHGDTLAVVEKVEPPHLFALRWIRSIHEGVSEQNNTLVEFTLSAVGDGTRLRVVESGFRDLDWPEQEKENYAEGNRKGWEIELGELREYVSSRLGESARR